MIDVASVNCSGPTPAAALAAHVDEFAQINGAALSGSDAIECMHELERIKNAAAAAQARLAVSFEQTQRKEAAAAGVPAARRSRGVGAQIGLARQESPAHGSRHLGLARVLCGEMLCTLAALTAGDITEWRATILARETAMLSAEHRARVDAELGPRLAGMGDREIDKAAKALAYELDPASALARMRGAREQRRVSIRPGPESMVYLTGYLPQRQGIAAYAALYKATAASRDARSQAQAMADLMIERLTGAKSAEDISTEVVVIVDDDTLLGDSDAPARIPGHGPVPAAYARDWIRDTDAAVRLRRIYRSAETGSLVAMDSRSRIFDGELRKFLILRDDTCRTPWCDAVIKHIDHVQPAAEGGSTTAENGQGLCAACNYAKEAPGWTARSSSRDGPHVVTTTTPTGHTYTSTAPDPPHARVDMSWVERRLAQAITLAYAA